MSDEITAPAPARAPHADVPTIIDTAAPKSLVVLASIALAAALLPAGAAIVMALNGQL